MLPRQNRAAGRFPRLTKAPGQRNGGPAHAGGWAEYRRCARLMLPRRSRCRCRTVLAKLAHYHGLSFCALRSEIVGLSIRTFAAFVFLQGRRGRFPCFYLRPSVREAVAAQNLPPGCALRLCCLATRVDAGDGHACMWLTFRRARARSGEQCHAGLMALTWDDGCGRATPAT